MKLILSMEKHPHLYKITWSSKGNEVPTLCCWLAKDFKDEIWYDVALMDACHIFLGRLWLYEHDILSIKLDPIHIPTVTRTRR